MRSCKVLFLSGTLSTFSIDIDLYTVTLQKSFQSMPSKPSGDLGKLGGITNQEQEEMLETIADNEVVEEDLGEGSGSRNLSPQIAAELTEKQKRFYALFKNTTSESEIQASVPDQLDLAAVKKIMKSEDLPTVHDTPEEKEAKIEDMARRAAYLAMEKKAEKDPKRYKECHDMYVANFNDYYKKYE